MSEFKMKYGNLIKESSDFIVNASNTELILGSGVSKAFREYCGGSFFQQSLYILKKKYIQEYGIIKQGDIILSDSGVAKNFKYSLHVAIMNYTDSNQIPFPTYKHIKKALENILSTVEEISIKENIKKPKITIPLIGTGTGGLKKERIYLLIKKILNQTKNDLEVIVYFYTKKDFIKYYLIEKMRKHIRK